MSIENLKTFGKSGRHLSLLVSACLARLNTTLSCRQTCSLQAGTMALGLSIALDCHGLNPTPLSFPVDRCGGVEI